MFGYVKAYKPELKLKDYELYKGVYCSVCKQLGRKYGPLAQLSLSYDITFLALIRLSASSGCPHFKASRCFYNPLKKCNCCEKNNEEIDYSVDCAVIMLYYKLIDNIKDSGFIKRIAFYFVYPFYSLLHRKAKTSRPQIEYVVKSAMEEQAEVENRRTQSIDEAAHPSSKALSALLSNGYEGDKKLLLERLGYLIGRWIYIIDAADDLLEDIKKGNYNPYISLLDEYNKRGFSGISEFKDYLTGVLNLTVDECLKAFELLELEHFRDILTNILYMGLENTRLKVFSEERWLKHEKSI